MPVFSGVRNGPGEGVDGDLVPASPTARLWVSWTRAPLLAAYPDRAAAPAGLGALAMVRMRPYPSARMGTAILPAVSREIVADCLGVIGGPAVDDRTDHLAGMGSWSRLRGD
jgi:hypothetical protein